MTTRRAEPFRYSMIPPIKCWMEIVEINGASLTSKLAEAKLVNISKSGCCIESELDLYVHTNSILALVHIQLTEKLYIIRGEFRWQRQLDSLNFNYGVALQTSGEDKENITVELRTLAADKRVVVM